MFDNNETYNICLSEKVYIFGVKNDPKKIISHKEYHISVA